MNNRAVTRRFFVKQGALAFAALGAGSFFGPGFLRSSVMAAENSTQSGGKKVLVCLFQRGAADGLSMVVPYGEKEYSLLRPAIGLGNPSSEGGVLDLDGHFGMHPAMAPLHEFYGAGELAVVHACGNPEATRSHFEAQDLMESGTGQDKNLISGWLNRMIGVCPEDAAKRSALRALAMTNQLPRSLQGQEEALAVANFSSFGLRGALAKNDGAGGFEKLYENVAGDVLHGAGRDGFEAMQLLRGLEQKKYQPQHGAEYPGSPLGRSLRQVAQLIKAGVGLEVAFVETGGWDTHVNQGAAGGSMANRLTDMADSLAALHRDLGARMSEVLVLTMSEFGRTVKENGSRGTDHGHGTAFLALGGGVRGGRVLGDWPGLAPDKLFEGRDLAITTDYRDFFAEACVRHMGVAELDLAQVFPGHQASISAFRGYLS
jgi:uncharacterized protein (DUF1501 family)